MRILQFFWFISASLGFTFREKERKNNMVIHNLNRLQSYHTTYRENTSKVPSLFIRCPCDFVHSFFALNCTTGRLGVCGFQLVFSQMRFWPYRTACLGEALVQEYSTPTGLTKGIRSAIILFQNWFLSSQSLYLLRAKKE